ncbi:MAG: adenine phosphoribosyltransferase [Sedimentisphaeraceae bacterium JB056]
MELQKIRELVRDIEDFPTPGIIFRDITPLLANPQAFNTVLDMMAEPYINKKIDHIAAIDARGFIFGSAIARSLGAGFIPLRKKGKLPYKKVSDSYSLEYGINEIEMHIDAIKEGENVLIVDDLLATGGTLKAACNLVEQLKGNVVGISLLIELTALEGRKNLINYQVDTVLEY